MDGWTICRGRCVGDWRCLQRKRLLDQKGTDSTQYTQQLAVTSSFRVGLPRCWSGTILARISWGLDCFGEGRWVWLGYTHDWGFVLFCGVFRCFLLFSSAWTIERPLIHPPSAPLTPHSNIVGGRAVVFLAVPPRSCTYTHHPA